MLAKDQVRAHLCFKLKVVNSPGCLTECLTSNGDLVHLILLRQCIY